MDRKGTINERIAEARVRSKLTQAQVGKMIGVEANTVSMYERGDRNPSLDVIALLSQVLHVSTDYLILGEDRKEINAAGLDGEEFELISDLVIHLTRKNRKRKEN